MTCQHLELKKCLAIVLCLALSGCAVKRPAQSFAHKWRSSEQAYDRWAVKMCEKAHPVAECDPNWKPEAVDGR